MAVGTPYGKPDIDQTAGDLAVQTRDLFIRIKNFHFWLLAQPDGTLTSAPYNYLPADLAVLRSSFSDLNKLADIYLGAVALPVAQDFRQFSKQLMGVR